MNGPGEWWAQQRAGSRLESNAVATFDHEVNEAKEYGVHGRSKGESMKDLLPFAA
jgi:hypothetical protein